MQPVKTLRSIEAGLENIQGLAESIEEGTISYFIGMAILEAKERVASTEKLEKRPSLVANAGRGSTSFSAAQTSARSA